MGIPIISGRDFGDQDVRDFNNEDPTREHLVAIINKTFASRFFPDEDPIGKRFVYGNPSDRDPWYTIVGVVGDMRRTGFDAEVRPETFLPHAQDADPRMTLVARTSADPEGMAGTIKGIVKELDGGQPVFNVKTADETLGEMKAQRRLNMMLFAVFAAIALLLAAVGIYGVISYSVTQRTHEFGIRIALGAKRSDVLRLVVGQGMVLSLVGVAIGLAASVALTRFMASLLYEVGAIDPVTFAIVAVALVGVALVACFVPARRATRVDPMEALRYE
jgi:putative ABC transport system permease protein